MPKIDPVTGCTVMTMAEFLNAEGEREGKTGGEVLDEIVQSLEDDNRQMEAEWRKPEVALSLLMPILKRDYDAWVDTERYYNEHPELNEKPDPEPINPEGVVRVIEVLEAKSHQSFRESGGTIVARLEMKKGPAKLVRANWWHDYGTRLDPPDGDEEILEITETQLEE